MFRLASGRALAAAATARPMVSLSNTTASTSAASAAASTTFGSPSCFGTATTKNARHFSSQQKDLSQILPNVTPEQLEENEELKAFVAANFPQVLDPDYVPPQPPHLSSRGSPGLIKPEIAEDDMPEPSYARNIRPLTTHLRDAERETNSRRSRNLRQYRLIPGLLYGGDPTRGIFSNQSSSKVYVKTHWQLLERELDRFHREFESRVYELTVLEAPSDDDDDDGEEENAAVAIEPQLVVPANVQRHPVKESVYCVNFVRYHPGRPLKLPIRQINQEESPALKRDGYILPQQRRVEVFVEEGADIPTALELECTGLRIKDVIRKDRLVLPPGVRLSDRVLKRGDEYILGVVDGSSRGAEEEETTT